MLFLPFAQSTPLRSLICCCALLMLQNLCLPFGPFSIKPLQHMRSHQDCPIPIPGACSFLILENALRFGGGSAKKNGAASKQGHQFFFWGRPPPLGNSVRSMSATLATLRRLCPFGKTDTSTTSCCVFHWFPSLFSQRGLFVKSFGPTCVQGVGNQGKTRRPG